MLLHSLISPSALMGIALAISADTLTAGDTLYIASRGTGGETGVYAAGFADGKLDDARKVLSLPGNSCLALGPGNKTMVVSSAAGGKEDGELIALEILLDGGLRELNRVPLEVDHFCSLAISKDGRTLLGASFGRGVVASYRLNEDGSIRKRVSYDALPRFPRGKSDIARAHDIEFNHDEMLAFVPDIANNRVYVFDVDAETGALSQRSFVTSDSFLGPRHLIPNADSSILYVLNQKGSSIVAFRHDGDGGLSEFQAIPTIPPDYDGPQNHSAEILLHPNGKFLYASNRNHDSLAGYRIGDDGTLTTLQSIPSGGESPWSFVFDSTGEYLICSNLKSENLVVFQVDQVTGKLRRLEGEIAIPEPNSVVFAGAR